MSKSLQPIKDVVLAVTYQCNSRCLMCNIWKNELTYSSQPADYNNLPRDIEYVNISGGEPFLRKDLAEIIRVITKRCPQASLIISTNGFCPETIREQMPAILKINRDIGVAVSLDGLKETHESLRGIKGGFDKTYASIQILRNVGVKNIKIAFTLSDANYADLPAVYKLSKALNVEFSLSLCHNSEHFFQKDDNDITEPHNLIKAINWLIKQELKGFWPSKKWVRAYFAHGLKEYIINDSRLLPDYSGFNSLFVDPYGEIHPSDVWNLRLGNLTQINSWSHFLAQAQAQLLTDHQAPTSWMVCTARQAIKKHRLKVGFWILLSKLSLI